MQKIVDIIWKIEDSRTNTLEIPLTILIEGKTDEIILRNIFEAAQFPLDKIEFIQCHGKNNIIEVAKELNNTDIRNVIALIDSDEINIPDCEDYIRRIIGIGNVQVYCAIPSIEAWVFGDDQLIEKDIAKKGIIKRLPLPEELPYPKYLLNNILKNKHNNYNFLKEMNISRACARTPALKCFLQAIADKMDIQMQEIEESYSRNMDRNIMINLIKEISNHNTIIYRTLDGERYTAEEMEKEIRNGSTIGKQYSSDVLRIARDILKRQAQKEVQK